jgi:hypothetical protein
MMSYSPTIGRWLEEDPIGYADGMNQYQFVADNPVASTDPTGLFAIDWYKGSGWTIAEKQRLQASLARVRANSDKRIGDINKYIQTLKGMKCDMSTPIKELENLRDILKQESAGIADPDANLEFVKKNLGKPETAFQHHYYFALTDNIEFNTTAKRLWNTMPDLELDSGMAHELSHHYGTEDDDSKGLLINAHHIADLFQFQGDISRFIWVRSLVMDAEKKCAKHACNTGSGSPPMA